MPCSLANLSTGSVEWKSICDWIFRPVSSAPAGNTVMKFVKKVAVVALL